jgi:hypothetical protein
MTCWHTAPSSRRFSTIRGLARPPEVFLRKNMAPNRGGDSFVAHTKSAGAGQFAGAAARGTEQGSLLRLRDPGCVQIGFEIVVAGHLLDLAAFLMQPTHHRLPWSK